MSIIKNYSPATASARSSGNVSVGRISIPIGGAISGNFVEVSPQDPQNQMAAEPRLQSDLNQFNSSSNQTLVNWWKSQFSLANNGWVYFYISDPHSGAPQTPGELPGIAIMRIKGTSGEPIFQQCLSTANIVAAPAAPLQQVQLPATAVTTPLWEYVLFGAIGLIVVGGVVYYATE